MARAGAVLGAALGAAGIAACSLIDTSNLSSGDDGDGSRGAMDAAFADAPSSDATDDATMASDGASDFDGAMLPGADSGPSASDGGDAAIDAGPLTYAARVLADHPLAYFRLADIGAIASSEVNAATYTGVYSGDFTQNVPGAIEGDTNGAIHFPGTDGDLNLGDVFGFPSNAPFSLEIWVRISIAADGQFRRILGRESPGGAPNGYNFLNSNGGGGPSFNVSANGTASAGLAPSSPLVVGEWTYFVITYNGSNLDLYENAIPEGVTLVTNPMPAKVDGGGIALRLGADPNNFSQWNGDLDEFAVYDHALDAATIRAHYALAGSHDAGAGDGGDAAIPH